MKLPIGRFVVLSVLFAGAAAGAAFAQATGTIIGAVVDESGGVIAGAIVSVDGEAGRALASTTTDAAGSFTLKGVGVGHHTVRVEKPQFGPARVDVSVGSELPPTSLHIVLKVAAIREAVDVRTDLTAERSYSKETATSAGKADIPIMETPFSVEVVPSQAIADQQAIRLSDITKNVSGVQTNWGYGQQYEGFALRGFETNTTLRDGVRAPGVAGRTSVDVANIEDVEVLKGPAAMLYGRLEPGGLINVVTKQPLATPHFSLQQQVGSYNLSRTTADATGPLTPDGSVLYRVIGEYFSSDSFFTHAPHGKTQFVAPSLTWRPAVKFQANVNVEYRNYDPLLADGIPAIGTRPANIPVTTWVGDLGDQGNITKTLVDVNASYLFNANWKIHGSVVANWQTYNAGEITPISLDETPGPTFGDLANGVWFVHAPSNGRNLALDVTGHLGTGGVDHALLFGTDYYQLNFSYTGFVNGFAPLDTINIFNPTYSRPTGFGSHAAYSSMPPDWATSGSSGWNGVYAQDQIKLSKTVQVLAGGRYDWSRTSSGQVLLEYAPPGTTINDLAQTTARETKFSPRLGLIYQPIPSLSLYGNYVQSLGTWGTQAGIAADVDGHPLPAERSASYEGGFKTEFFQRRLRSTLAVFNITKNNMATRDLSSPNPNALLAIGEARSRGVEVDVAGSLTRQINVIATYAFDAATFTKDNTGLQGNAIANVPRHSGSVWLKAQLIPTLFVGGGAVLRGERQGDNQNSFQLPGYVTVDAVAGYTLKAGHSTLVPQINVSNLTNTRYFINTNVYDAYPRTGIMPGQPRTVMASIKWEY
ncbi:MAG TPA: TonB-dependent receptor [Vicinamibacterales bacterium]|nr:TonB-dependent receptor [Vicinamibacterales bacterium]